MSLPTRKIGNADVPYPGLGTMGMSAFYDGAGKTESNLTVLKAAYDSGCRFWDTADMYGNHHMGENEQLLAKAFKEGGVKREDIFLGTYSSSTTKFGNFRAPDGTRSIIGTPAYVASAIDKSLADLQVPFVDLYYQHRVDKNTPIEETVGAMQKLKEAGKIRHIGLSECSAETLRRASKVAKVDAVQWEYSLWETSIETNGVLEACKELGITLVAYSPLGRGMLTGKLKSRADLSPTDFRYHSPRFSEENFPKNLELVDKITAFAEKKGCTPAQLALAWVHAQWEGIIAIPGTTRLEGLKENIGSVGVELTDEELKEVRVLLDSFVVQGDRYPAAAMASLNV
ncbi:Aldo/keto reductase [Calocera viscosa TUFC12733]|uniref:Aldo/keto reductase n=1 Tax=Calocera viscosa (strain TUFC12733) TaxID=1330018 RepID=A0A167JIQ4_CALVF|nr:Aldo/keto reductase [Calocera viscosa TUFC12733]